MGLVDEAVGNLIQITLQRQQPDATFLQLTHRFLGKANMVIVDTFKRSWEDLLTQQLKSFVEKGTSLQTPL